MISADSSFITAVAGNARHFAAKIIHNSSEVQCDIIKITASKGAQDGQTFTLGSVFSSSAEITCAGLSDNLENEDITLQIGIQTGADTYSYITYGQYTVIKTQKTAFQTVLTCTGVIASKFNLMLPDIPGTPTISSIAAAIQTVTGVTVTVQGTGSGALAEGFTDMTCRSALSVLAFAVGGFATETNTGAVVIRPFAIPQSSQALSSENCLTPPIVAEDPFEMTGIKVIVQSDVYVLTADTTVVSGKTYYTRSGAGTDEDPYVYTPVESPTGNPASQGWYELGEIAYSSGSPIRQTYENKYISQTVFNALAASIIGYEFDPAEIDMSLGDPRLEPQDCLTVTDVDGITTYTVPCHLIQSVFDGGFSSKIYSIGESVSDITVTGSISQSVKQAITDADVAKAAAASAQAYAEQAKQTTDEINAYAETAGKTVTQILEDGETASAMAQQASDSAQQAYESAGVAYNSANQAMSQLAIVEDVVGVLELVQNNGDYQRTTDDQPLSEKWYFTRTGTGTSEDPYIYELQNEVVFEYVLTSDTAVIPDKPYYTRSGSGTDEDPYVYTPVENPVDADIGTYYEYTNWNYFELVGVDEAIQNYVSSHLVLVGDSLYLQNEDTRLQLSTTQGVILYNESGEAVAQYGTDTIIGNLDNFGIKIGESPDSTQQNLIYEIGFYQDGNRIAYINNNSLYITQTVVLQEMKLGDTTAGVWAWSVHTVSGQNNLYLKWLGTEG